MPHSPVMLLVYCKPLISLGLIQTNNKGRFFYSKLSPRVSFKAASSPFIPGVYCDSDQLCSFKPAVKQVSAYLSYTYGRNLTRAHIAGLWHERGNPCCRHNPACMSFYSNWLLLGLTHIFKSHFQFITSSFASLWKVSNVTTGSSLSPQAHLSLTVVKSLLGGLAHHLLCFHELCVLLLSPRLSQGFQKKKRRGSPQQNTRRTPRQPAGVITVAYTLTFHGVTACLL